MKAEIRKKLQDVLLEPIGKDNNFITVADTDRFRRGDILRLKGKRFEFMHVLKIPELRSHPGAICVARGFGKWKSKRWDKGTMVMIVAHPYEE